MASISGISGSATILKIFHLNLEKIIFLFFIIAVIAMQLRTFTRFHWIIHDHVIHELYCHINMIWGNQKVSNERAT
jgi:hypothetical protein